MLCPVRSWFVGVGTGLMLLGCSSPRAPAVAEDPADAQESGEDADLAPVDAQAADAPEVPNAPDAPATPKADAASAEVGDAALVEAPPACTGTSCEDGNACTIGDICSAGTCLPGPATACTDGNPCTDDGCTPAIGCVFLANTVTCSADADPCTEDRCGGGACLHSPASGAACDDGDPCTIEDSCAAGKCQGAPSLFQLDWAPSATSPTNVASIVALPDGGWLAGADADDHGHAVSFGPAGEVVWQTNLPGKYSGALAVRDGGFAAWSGPLPGPESLQAVDFLQSAGGLESLAPLPPGIEFSAMAGLGQDLILACWPEDYDSTGSVRRLSAAGVLGPIVPIGAPFSMPNDLRRRPQGDLVVAVNVLPSEGVHQLVYLDDKLKVTHTTLLEVGQPAKVYGGAQPLHVDVADDGSAYVTGTVMKSGPPGQKSVADHAFLARVGPDGTQLWVLPLPMEGVGATTAVTVVALAGGGADVVADIWEPTPAQVWHWRVSADGELRSRRQEISLVAGQKQLARAGTGSMLGGTAVDPGFVGHARLIRADAFGNHTCQDAGACALEPAMGCDDGNACTGDLCSAATGCTHTAFAEGTPCMPGKSCKSGVCEP